MRLPLLFTTSALLFLLSSCKKYQPADAAFFIRPGVVKVSTGSGQGTADHKVTDLWLYVNGKFQGAYPVGSLLPVISKDKAVTINMFAGIKNNGISDTRIFYPFFDFLTLDTLVESGKTIEHSFVFKYRPATKFAWQENFDSNGFSIKDSNKSDTKFQKSSQADSFEGSSVVMRLTDNNVIARIESSEGFALPSGSSNVYLELNYKCNTEFTIGLMNNDGTQDSPALRINPHEEWNKIYVQLSVAVSTMITSKYKVYVEFIKNPDDPETKQVFLDNIKLIYL